MRIADHAPVVQGSQVLQQPSNLVHQQQVQAPLTARVVAAMEAQQHATQVNDSTHAEGRTIQDRPGGGRSSTGKGGKRKDPTSSTPEDSSQSAHVSPPGSGRFVDIVV
jgi:hypothetical protein